MSEISYIGLGRVLADGLNDEPDIEVISLLSKLLEDAKSGKLKSCAVAGVSNLGEFMNASAGQGDFARLIGAIEMMKMRLFLMNQGKL